MAERKVRNRLLTAITGQDIIADMPRKTDTAEYYRFRILTLPGVTGVRINDGKLCLRTPAGQQVVPYKLHHGVMNRLVAQRLIEQGLRTLVLAHYVPPAVGHIMAKGGVLYVDLAGNCHLAFGKGCFIHVEGNKRVDIEGARQGRGLGTAGYEVLFAILVRPDLLGLPVRQFADIAGIPKTVVAETLQRLVVDGTIGVTRRRGREILRRDALLNKWLTGYEDHIRPKMLFGHYRAREENPVELEKRIEVALADVEWAWGGAAAAYRLTHYYRGETTVIHIPRLLAGDIPLRLGARRDEEGPGPIILLGLPGRLAVEGPQPRTPHPLLIYAELLHAGDDRAREAAAMLRERFPV